MWYRIPPLLRIIAVVAITVTILGFGISGFVNFVSSNPAPRSILRIFFYLILVLGLAGVVCGVISFFSLGVESYWYNRYRNRIRYSFDFTYEKVVCQTADYLILLGGALLFLWLL
jgi:uncharacterized membrane protein